MRSLVLCVAFLGVAAAISIRNFDVGASVHVDDEEGMQVIEEVNRQRRGGKCSIKTSSNTMTSKQRKDIVDAHNLARRRVDPKASNMVDLKWDNYLADLAQYWANKCTWGHDHLYKCVGDESKRMGQNMFMSSSPKVTNFTGAIGAFEKEKQYYNYAKHSCSKVCGHYTQVVWATSTHVGCAYTSCGKVKAGSSTKTDNTILVCNYFPPGNYKGKRPYLTSGGGGSNSGSSSGGSDSKSKKDKKDKSGKGCSKKNKKDKKKNKDKKDKKNKKNKKG